MNDNTEPAVIAASAVGRTLLKCLSDELERQPAAWSQMTELDQHQALERMRQAVRTAVADAMRVIFGQQMPAVPATLDNLSSKGTISMRLTVAKTAANRHELLDAVGHHVVVLIGDPEAYLEGLNDIKAKTQQPDLFSDPELPDLESDIDDEPKPGCRGCAEPVGAPHKLDCSVRAELIKDGEHDADLVLEADTEVDEEAAAPEPEPGPDDVEDNWVETGNDPHVERNRVTQKTRVSRRALAVQLLERVTTWNAEAKNPSIRFTHDTMMGAGRQELLMALTWLDAYAADQATEQQPPPFLLPERPAP